MIQEVHFLPQANAEHLVPLKREGIISITGSNYPRARLLRGWRRVLRLVFDDTEKPIPGGVHFDQEHAKAVIVWLDAVESVIDKVFVHCHAGKRRSGAVALFIAQRYEIPGGIHVYEGYNPLVYKKLVRAWKTRKISRSRSKWR